MADSRDKRFVDIEMAIGGFSGVEHELRCAFICKVYAILCVQLVMVFGVSLAMTLVHPVRKFMLTDAGYYVLFGAMGFTIIVFILMLCLRELHPVNYILLFLFTLGMAFTIGAVCSHQKAETVLLAAGLTLVASVGLTLFTFVAAKRGWDFSFLGPFLFSALLLLLAFVLFRIFFHTGKLGNQLMGAFGALVFCGYMVYDTFNLIKRFTYDQYIEAALCLFLDIINLFLQLLALMGADD